VKCAGWSGGRLDEEYHDRSFNPRQLAERVNELYGDPYAKNRKGISEYVFGRRKIPSSSMFACSTTPLKRQLTHRKPEADEAEWRSRRARGFVA